MAIHWHYKWQHFRSDCWVFNQILYLTQQISFTNKAPFKDLFTSHTFHNLHLKWEQKHMIQIKTTIHWSKHDPKLLLFYVWTKIIRLIQRSLWNTSINLWIPGKSMEWGPACRSRRTGQTSSNPWVCHFLMCFFPSIWCFWSIQWCLSAFLSSNELLCLFGFSFSQSFCLCVC